MNSGKIILFLILMLLSGCRTGTKDKSDNTKEVSTGVLRAERFTIEKKDGWTEVRIIDPWQGAKGVNQIYYLVKRGSKVPEGIDSSEIIFVPLKKIVCMSTTHLSMISALNEEKTIVGVSGTSFIYSAGILKNAENGLVADVGYEANLNKELVLKLSPDIIMIYGIGSESTGYVGKIKELGIRVLINADYLETDPLGRAEWIKLFGALYCKESLADSIYNSEVESYNKLKSEIAGKNPIKPKVLLGLPFKDTWYISPGNSYICKLITDAGGDYLWKDIKSATSMPYGIENVYMRALKADFWLNISTARSKTDILNVDQRLGGLPCFKSGKLFNNNNRTTEKGGNDFWENGCLYPHLILKDIATILHPEIFTDRSLVYYRKVN